MTRFAIVAIVAAGLAAAPAAAQEANQASAADPTAVIAEPDTANNTVEPVMPVTNEAVAIEPMAPVLDPSLDPDARQARRDDRGFPWGVLGLIGLIGLLGRRRG